MPPVINLPAPRFPGNALLDLGGLANSIRTARLDSQRSDQLAQQNERADAQLDLQRQRVGIANQQAQTQQDAIADAREQKAVQQLSTLATMVNEADPAERAGLIQQITPVFQKARTSIRDFDSDLLQAGVQPDDLEGALNAFAVRAQAERGPVDPLERRGQVAKVEKTEAEVAKLKQDVRQAANEPAAGGAEVTSSMKTIIQKADVAFDNLVPALDDYAATVARTGPNLIAGQDKDEVAAKRRNIQLQLKELFNLGVLNGPDLDLMDTLLFNPNIDNPFEVTNAFNAASRAQASVDRIKEEMRRMRNNLTSRIGLPPAPPFASDGGNQPPSATRAQASAPPNQGQANTPAAPEVRDLGGGFNARINR